MYMLLETKDKIMLVLHTSKTHGKNNKPQKITITGNGNVKEKRNFCPFELTKEYIDVRGSYCQDSDPFFIFRDGSVLKPIHVRKTLRNILERLNLNPALYDTHSFRIGKASDMLKFGYSLAEIRQKGRWASNAVYKYLRN